MGCKAQGRAAAATPIFVATAAATRREGQLSMPEKYDDEDEVGAAKRPHVARTLEPDGRALVLAAVDLHVVVVVGLLCPARVGKLVALEAPRAVPIVPLEPRLLLGIILEVAISAATVQVEPSQDSVSVFPGPAGVDPLKANALVDVPDPAKSVLT